MSTKNQQGQTLILTLIVTVISLVIGVAISSRAVSTLKQTSYTAQAGKAQKFADAGAEEALALSAAELDALVGTPVSRDVDGIAGDDVTYTVTRVGGGTTVDATLQKDQTIQLDLYDGTTRYPSNRDIKIYWVLEGDAAEDKTQPGNNFNTEAAIVVSLIYSEAGQTKLAKFAFDPNEADRGNNFDVPNTTGGYVIGGVAYKYEAIIPQQGAGKDYEALRIRPLYNTVTNTAVVTNDGVLGTFPTQGHTITSTGAFGDALWTVEVTKMNPALPAIFDFAIFSESDLTK